MEKPRCRTSGCYVPQRCFLTGCEQSGWKDAGIPGQAQPAPAEPSSIGGGSRFPGIVWKGKSDSLCTDDIVLPKWRAILWKNEVLQEKVAQSRDEFAGIMEDWENILENTIQEIENLRNFQG